jgi:hypothetical protein
MVLGSIAIDAPLCRVGNAPLEELRIASSMFNDAAVLTASPRTKNGAEFVQKILARAEETHAKHLAVNASAVRAAICIPPTDYGDDELAIFGGQTRLAPPSSHQTSPQPRQGSSSHNSNPSGSSLGSLDDVHPSLIDFLAMAPVTLVASPMSPQEMEGATSGPPLASSFDDHGFMSPQSYGWEYGPLPMSQSQRHFENVSGPSTSGLQIFDTFESYMNRPVPSADIGSEPTTLTPWQEFMRQNSLPE